MSFFDHGHDPAGAEKRTYRSGLLDSGRANYDDNRSDSYAAEDQFLKPPEQAKPEAPDPYQLGPLERHICVSDIHDEDGDNRGSGFNDMWMRDHWKG